MERPVTITVRDLVRHVLVVGPTGTGKSTWLWNLVNAIIAAGYGVVLIDPKADLASKRGVDHPGQPARARRGCSIRPIVPTRSG